MPLVLRFAILAKKYGVSVAVSVRLYPVDAVGRPGVLGVS